MSFCNPCVKSVMYPRFKDGEIMLITQIILLLWKSWYLNPNHKVPLLTPRYLLWLELNAVKGHFMDSKRIVTFGLS